MLHYDLYANPGGEGNLRRKRLHARVVTYGTVKTQELAEGIQGKCTITTADVKGTLDALSDELIDRLGSSRRVHIEGLGYFQLTLSCPPVRMASEIRSQSVRVKSLSFRPDKEMKKAISRIRLERAPRKKHSKVRGESDVDQLLTGYFRNHPSITCDRFESLCGFLRSTAYCRLSRLVAAGKLEKKGSFRNRFYEPVAGYYGRK